MVDPIALLIKITSHILQPHCWLSNCHTAADNPNTHPAARPESGKGHSLAIWIWFPIVLLSGIMLVERWYNDAVKNRVAPNTLNFAAEQMG
jgi:hypothetical protein